MLWMLASVTRGRRRWDAGVRISSRAFRLSPIFPTPRSHRNGDVSIGPDVHFDVDTTGDRGCSHAPPADVLLSPSASINVADTTRTRITVARRASVADSTRYLLAVDSTTRRNNPHVFYIDGGHDAHRRSPRWCVNRHRPNFASPVVLSFQESCFAGTRIDATLGEPIVRGAVLAFGAPGTTVVQFARASLQFASCVAFRALQLAHAPRRVRERSWAEMY
jgi:hypothetical protein